MATPGYFSHQLSSLLNYRWPYSHHTFTAATTTVTAVTTTTATTTTSSHLGATTTNITNIVNIIFTSVEEDQVTLFDFFTTIFFYICYYKYHAVQTLQLHLHIYNTYYNNHFKHYEHCEY